MMSTKPTYTNNNISGTELSQYQTKAPGGSNNHKGTKTSGASKVFIQHNN